MPIDTRYTAISPLITEQLRRSAGLDRAIEQQKIEPVKPDSGEQKNNSNRFLRRQFDDEGRALARLVPPKASLSPSEEVALFASEAQGNTGTPATTISKNTASILTGEAVAEDGSQVSVEIITDPKAAASQPPKVDVVSLAAQARATAAQLYARNNDIVFTATPLTQIAA